MEIIISSYKPNSQDSTYGCFHYYDSDFEFFHTGIELSTSSHDLASQGRMLLIQAASDKIAELDSIELCLEEKGFSHTIKVLGYLGLDGYGEELIDEESVITFIRELAKTKTKILILEREAQEEYEKARVAHIEKERAERRRYEILKARFEKT